MCPPRGQGTIGDAASIVAHRGAGGCTDNVAGNVAGADVAAGDAGGGGSVAEGDAGGEADVLDIVVDVADGGVGEDVTGVAGLLAGDDVADVADAVRSSWPPPIPDCVGLRPRRTCFQPPPSKALCVAARS